MLKSHSKKPLAPTRKPQSKKPLKKATRSKKKPLKKADPVGVSGLANNKRDIPEDDLNNLNRLQEKINRDDNLNQAKEKITIEKEEQIINGSPSPDSSNIEIDESVLNGIYDSCIDVFEGTLRFCNEKFLKCNLTPFEERQRQALKTSGSSLINKILPDVVIQNPEVFGFSLCVISIWAKNTKPLLPQPEPQKQDPEPQKATNENMYPSFVPGAEAA